MLRRTNGIILLTLLVVTGLAGRLFSETISSKERRLLIEDLKTSRTYLQKTIKGLSNEQLNFKPSENASSIKEYLEHIASSEKALWHLTDKALKEQPDSKNKAAPKLTDEQLVSLVNDKFKSIQTCEFSKIKSKNWENVYQVITSFKDNRADLIKYAKTSTDDMRNHIIQTAFGSLDAYQMMLLISSHTRRHTLQMEEITTHRKFPK